MAIGLENYPNIDVSDPAKYPSGAIKDNPGDNTGTPVNKLVYNDMHQFFFALLLQAGIAATGNPENAVDGYQYIEALVAKIRATIATDTQKGTVELATQTEVDTGTDIARSLTPATLAAAKTVIGDVGKLGLKTKVVNIGTWDMDGTATVSITHGITDFKKIRSVTATIRNDDDDKYYILENTIDGSFNISGAIGEINSTLLYLTRKTGGVFDSTDFNNTSGSFNRGFVTILYFD